LQISRTYSCLILLLLKKESLSKFAKAFLIYNTLYTGLQLSQDLDTRVRQTNAAAYLSPARKNYFLRMAVVKMLEDNYVQVVKQKSVDEISPLIKTYTPFVPYNNKVLIKPLHIVSIANPSGNIFQIVFDRPHNIDFATFTTIDVTFSGLEGGTYTTLNGETYSASVDLSLPLTAIRITAIGLSGTYTPNTGEVTGDYWCADYYHLLAISLNCLKNLNVTIVKVNTAGGCLITLGTHNIRTGERLKFSSFGGLTGLTGYKYVKKIGERQIRIYDDVGLTTQTTVTGTYTSGGIIEREHNEYCEYDYSDGKISADTATEHFPLFDANDNRLRCYSSFMNSNSYITNIKYYVDYIVRQAYIDITDATTDLLQTYNQEMCRTIIERAALMFFATNTSGEDVQITETLS
jgi:hypothetical protein